MGRRFSFSRSHMNKNDNKPHLQIKPAMLALAISAGLLCWWGLITLVSFIVSLINK